MISVLINHEELAKILGFTPGTIRNIWRSLPYVAVTPKARARPHLRGVRFDPEEVVNHLKNQRQKGGEAYGYQNTWEGQVPGVLQVSRETVQQNRQNQGGGQNLGGKKEGSPYAGGNAAADFDVFRRVRAVS